MSDDVCVFSSKTLTSTQVNRGFIVHIDDLLAKPCLMPLAIPSIEPQLVILHTVDLNVSEHAPGKEAILFDGGGPGDAYESSDEGSPEKLN